MQTPPLITSLSNPTVKQVRALRQHKRRVETGLFLVEGLHHVGEALEAGWDVDLLLYAPGPVQSGFGGELIERARERGVPVQTVSASVMESLAGKDNPQGILAVVRQRRQGFAALEGAARLAALVSPQDPGNVGAILRTIDAVGAGGLAVLDGGVDPYHPTAVRASMGTLFWKPVAQGSFADFVLWARGREIQLIGTSARGAADYRSAAVREPWALVLGSEQKGLSAEQMAVCELSLALPMHGRASSLNLAVAAGILLYSLSG
ncbi:MAG: TrmH family RNA methyltransferase [Bacteroidota bacterium]